MTNNIKRKVKVGKLYIGGDAPITVQSMTNVDTHNFEASYSQIKALEDVGCDIVRLAVPDLTAVDTIKRLKSSDIKVPLVADIHFDYKIAIACAEAGIDKIRINPGNIGSKDRVKSVVSACRERQIPIRIGVNGGSLEKDILVKYGAPNAEALAESALRHVRILEELDFKDIVVSIKSSNVKIMIGANRILNESCDYPLHIGVTEAGSAHMGTIKSAIGIGSLLADGIGNTIRVSLTESPLLEVKEGKALLNALGIDTGDLVEIISCPTCARTKIDLINLVKKFENDIMPSLKPSRKIKVALMGCAVNGPGEAREADIGIAGGINEALLFKKGVIIGKILEENVLTTLAEEINKM